VLFGHLWHNPTLLHTGLGMIYCTVVLASLAIWSPSFLVRIYGLGTHQAGLYSAVVVGACGACGAAGAGWLADRLAARGEWRRLNVALVGIVLSVICGFLAFLVASGLGLVLALLGLTAFFGQFYIGICNSVIATHAPDADRAGTISVLAIGYNLTAYGLGPTLVGFISDMLAPLVGTRSIGWGLATTLLFSLIGAGHFARARNALQRL
jgi:MFS family permease